MRENQVRREKQKGVFDSMHYLLERLSPRAINVKMHAWIFTLLQAYTGCKDESLFPPDNSAGTLGGQRYNCMCNMQQERGSHLHNYHINVHCERQPLHILDTWQHIHTSEHSHKPTNTNQDAKHILTDCNAAINTFTQITLWVDRDLPSHSHHSHGPVQSKNKAPVVRASVDT